MDSNSPSPAVVAHLEKLFQRANELTDKQRQAMVADFERCQHFLEDMLEGYEFDLDPPALEVMAKCYFVIWEHFKDKKNSQKRPIAEGQFIRLQKRNNLALQDAPDGLMASPATLPAFPTPTSNLLMERLQFWFESQPSIQSLPNSNQTELLIDLRTLVDCFEEITR